MESGTLYMIPCTIADGTAERVLPAYNRGIIDSLDYFIVENTRTARRFLAPMHLSRRIDDLEFRELNEHTTSEAEIESLVEPLLAGRSAGVISEAGVPGVADPGAVVAASCHRKGIKVVPLVGPSSILLALMASGQNGQSFAFNGYLPVKDAERAKRLRELCRRACTERQAQIFIETPYRNEALFKHILSTCDGSMRLTVAADISSDGEYIRTMNISHWRKAESPSLHKRPAIFILGI